MVQDFLKRSRTSLSNLFNDGVVLIRVCSGCFNARFGGILPLNSSFVCKIWRVHFHTYEKAKESVNCMQYLQATTTNIF